MVAVAQLFAGIASGVGELTEAVLVEPDIVGGGGDGRRTVTVSNAPDAKAPSAQTIDAPSLLVQRGSEAEATNVILPATCPSPSRRRRSQGQRW